MMSHTMTCEAPKKVRSVRFNDNALETIVSYNPDEAVLEEEYNYDDICRNKFQEDFFHDTTVPTYRRSGSHESLYDKISMDSTFMMNPRILKKRNSDLDDSYHCSKSNNNDDDASYHPNTPFDMSSFAYYGTSSNSRKSSSRCSIGDSDLDISHHDRQQRHYNKRVMCI